MATHIEKDDVSGTATTGHVWDGIRELNTPLPKWWLYTFYGCIVFALGYTVFYPAWPLPGGATPGILGWSSRGQLQEQMQVAAAAQKDTVDKIAAMNVNDILKDPKLLAYAQAGGAAAFKVNCVPCHGAGAAGGKGYPNLNDDDWLWGGTPDAIYTTLQHGIRYTDDPNTRDSQMPNFGIDGILTPEQIDQVANYVVTLSGETSDATKAAAGKDIFAQNCAACHGEDGKGNREFGAPNLSDKLWLYGGGIDNVKAQVTKPHMGVMPGWTKRLDDATIKELAIYVHSLGGGEAPATQ
jgi:cytochrome c oxidase cbb3-type subunit 3